MRLLLVEDDLDLAALLQLVLGTAGRLPDVDHLPKPYDLDRLVAMVVAHSRSGP
ncbi:MAG: hypothetical protein WD378_02775 [Egicoccus sp.]